MNRHSVVVRTFVGLLALMCVSGCHSSGPSTVTPIPLRQIPRTFSDADWAKVLTAVVTPDGYVLWNIVQSDSDHVQTPLLQYVGLINAVSPVNYPDLFATSNDRTAYWINAYNAMCFYAIIEHNYPGNVATLPTEKFNFGGQLMTLDDVVRTQLQPLEDPRIFFAINGCAISSPPLRSSPYDGAVLDAELVDQGQRYLGDPRAAVRDGDAVKLNDLFTTMHKSDFLDGYKKMLGVAPTGLLESLQPYVQSDSPIVGATSVENLGFDWRLNRPPR